MNNVEIIHLTKYKLSMSKRKHAILLYDVILITNMGSKLLCKKAASLCNEKKIDFTVRCVWV